MSIPRSPSKIEAVIKFTGVLIMALVFVQLWSPQVTHAATITWDGGGADGTCGGGAGDGNKWSCDLNWSTDTVPTSSDTAYFDGTSTKAATIDSAQTITALTMTTGYVGIVTQAADLTISGSFTHNSTDGTFTWSSGELIFAGTSGTWNVDTGDDAFGDVNLNTNTLTVTSSDTVVISNTLTLTNGVVNTGIIEVRGDLVHTATYDGGTTSIRVTQGVNDIDLISGGKLPGFVLSANRTVNCPVSGLVTINYPMTVSAGLFVCGAGDLDINYSLTISGTGSFTAPSGNLYVALFNHTDTAASAFDPNGGTVVFDGGILSSAYAYLSGSALFNDVTINLSNSGPLQVASGTLVVPGDLTLTNGYISAGTIEARGDIIHASTFDGGTGTLNITQGSSDISLVASGQMPGTTLSATRVINGPASGTVTFDGLFTLAAGTYTGGAGGLLLSGGLTMSGGAFTGGSGSLNCDGAFTLSGVSTSFTSTSGTFSVSGAWTHTDTAAFIHNSGTVTFDGSTQAIDINTVETFNVLNFSASGVKTIASGDSLVSVAELTLGDGSVNTGTLEPQGDVTVASTYDGGTAALLFSGAETQSFDLTGATGLFDADVTVSKSGGQVNLASALVMDAASQDLTIQEGKLNLAGQDLTVNGTDGVLVAEDGGYFQLQGAETIALNAGNPTLNSGSTVVYIGDGDGLEDTYVVTNFSAAYSNLTINSTDGATDIFELGEDLDVNGDLVLTSGTFDVVSGQNYGITLGGDWSNAGTFNARSGTLTLDGASQTFSGDSTFYNLSKTVTSSATLTLPVGGTQTVGGTLALQGVAGELLSIRSSSAGNVAYIDAQGTRSVGFLDVQDSNNVNSTSIQCTSGCRDSGNNTRWVFTVGGGTTYIGSGFIPSINYTGPQDGQVLGANTEQQLTWDADAFDGAHVNIDVSYDGGLTFHSLFINTFNDGIEPWLVPNVSSNEVMIKVALTDLIVESVFDVSTPFTIEISDIGSTDPTVDEELETMLSPNTYIRGVARPDVYFVDQDLIRHPFLNEDIYFTYHGSWEAVLVVSDELLSTSEMGSPMLPKPGVVLVKIQSVPKVYTVSLGDDGSTQLRWLSTEAVAEAMYGPDWADYVIDIPVTFWGKFSFGEDIDTPISVDLSTMKKRIDLHE